MTATPLPIHVLMPWRPCRSSSSSRCRHRRCRRCHHRRCRCRRPRPRPPRCRCRRRRRRRRRSCWRYCTPVDVDVCRVGVTRTSAAVREAAHRQTVNRCAASRGLLFRLHERRCRAVTPWAQAERARLASSADWPALLDTVSRDRTGEYRFGLRCGGIFKFSLRGGRVGGVGGEGETHTVRAHRVPWTTTLRGLYFDARISENTENVVDPAALDHWCSFLLVSFRSRRSLSRCDVSLTVTGDTHIENFNSAGEREKTKEKELSKVQGSRRDSFYLSLILPCAR